MNRSGVFLAISTLVLSCSLSGYLLSKGFERYQSSPQGSRYSAIESAVLNAARMEYERGREDRRIYVLAGAIVAGLGFVASGLAFGASRR